MLYLDVSLGLCRAKPLVNFYIQNLMRHRSDKKVLLQAQLHKFPLDPDYKKGEAQSIAHKAKLPYNKSQQDKYAQL